MIELSPNEFGVVWPENMSVMGFTILRAWVGGWGGNLLYHLARCHVEWEIGAACKV